MMSRLQILLSESTCAATARGSWRSAVARRWVRATVPGRVIVFSQWSSATSSSSVNSDAASVNIIIITRPSLKATLEAAVARRAHQAAAVAEHQAMQSAAATRAAADQAAAQRAMVGRCRLTLSNPR